MRQFLQPLFSALASGTPRIRRTVYRIMLGGTCVIALAFLGALVYRSVRQARNEEALAIRTPNRIDEGMFVKIGGIEQWIQVRGENRDNPVLLILSGGPGSSYLPFTPTFRSWERYFTVVLWDQRGAGRTYGRNSAAQSAPMTIDRMALDGIELAEFIRGQLNKRKVIVLAHSWGTVLGIPMVKRRPDLFYAYIGTGQIVNMAGNEALSYDLALKRVRATGDKADLKALEAIGRPPYEDVKSWIAKQRLIALSSPSTADDRLFAQNFRSAILLCPSYSLKDVYDEFAGIRFASRMLFKELMSYDARQLGDRFEIPMFFFQGDSDVITPTSLVEEYFSAIEAPQKDLVLLRDGGHTAVLLKPEVFLRELLADVRPLTLDRF